MPMYTTLVRRLPSAARLRAAWRTWSTISAVSRSRSKPSSPVAQNGQPTAQPRLRADAQRVPLAGGAAGRVVHQDRLDEQPVGEAVEHLLGQAAVGLADLASRRRCRSGRPRRAPSRRAAGSVRISANGRLAAPPRGVEDLARPVRRLAALDEPGRELLGREPADAGRSSSRTGGGRRGAKAVAGGRPVGRGSIVTADRCHRSAIRPAARQSRRAARSSGAPTRRAAPAEPVGARHRSAARRA